MKKYLFFAVIAFFATVIFIVKSQRETAPEFVCSDTIGCITIPAGEPVKIGVLQDFSGVAAIAGVDQLRSIEIAFKKHNNQLLNHPITLVQEDEKCSAEGGLIGSNKLISDEQIVAIIGTTCSEAAIKASKVVSDAGLVMLSGTNTAPSLTSVNNQKGENWHPGYFRITHSTIEVATGVAKFVFNELGKKKVATVDDGDTFTASYSESFRNEFVNLGGEIVLKETINQNENNMMPVLEAMVNSDAELVFLSLFPKEGEQIIRQSKKVSKLNDTAFLLIETMLTEEFLQKTNDRSKGFYFINSSPDPKSNRSKELTDKFITYYGTPPRVISYINTHDVTTLLLSAIKQVAIQEENNTLHIDRQALRDTLYATKNFPGITGNITCNEHGDCSMQRYNIVQATNPEAGLKALKANIIYSSTKTNFDNN